MSTGRPCRAIFAVLAAAAVLAADALGALKISPKYKSPRNGERDVRKKTSLIVLHTTEAPARSSLNKLSERGEAHFCVVEDGTVYSIIDHNRVAFHAGRSMWCGRRAVDAFSVGIEVVGSHDRPVTMAQIAALRELVASLKRIYRLPDVNVVTHSHVAYAAPNKWHKKASRGRKRCGMLFATPTVRRLLGLKTRPAFDPDVKARRLVNADPGLSRVLYGPSDFMRSSYAAAAKAAPARPAANNFWRRAGGAPAAKPAAKPAGPAKPSAPAKPANPAAPAPARPAQAPGFVRGRRVHVPPPAADAVPEGLYTIGKGGGSLASVARGMASSPYTVWILPDGAWGTGDRLRADAPLPEGTRVLVGYVAAGQVGPKRSAVNICGAKWRSPETWYFHGTTLVSGDRIDDKSIRRGTMIFVRK